MRFLLRLLPGRHLFLSSACKPWRVEFRDGREILRIRWLPTTAWTVLAGLVFYLGAVGIVCIRASHLQTAGVRFVDVALPFRWNRYREAIGDHYIAVGQHSLSTGDIQGGLHHLRVGLSKSPGHLPGRLLLARYFVSAGRPDLALPVLADGLRYAHHDPAFLSVAFHALLEHQPATAVVERSRELLGSGQLSPACVAVVACAQANAELVDGDYDGAEQSLRLHHVDATDDGRLLLARLDWARGYRELALTQLQALADSAPAYDPAQAQLAIWLRESGQPDAFRRLALVRRIAQPGNIAARIDDLDATSEHNRFDETASAILDDFGSDAAALIALAQYAADRGNVPLARRVVRHCQAANLAGDLAEFLLAETYLAARDYRSGLELVRTLRGSSKTWNPRHLALLDGFEALALRGLGDTAAAQLHVDRFLARNDLRSESMVTLARRFLDLGASTEARALLAHATVSHPHDQAALTELIALDLATDQLETVIAHLRRFVALRRPSPALLQSAYLKLASDRCLFLAGRDEILAALEAALARDRSRTG